VDQCPGVQADVLRVTRGERLGLLRTLHQAQHDGERGPGSLVQLRIRRRLRSFRPEHDAEQVRVADGEHHVGDPRLAELVPRVVGAAGHPLEHALAQGAEAVRGDGGDERRLVLEVVVGGHMADPRLAGDGAHGEGREAALANDLERGVEQRRAEVAVVIGFAGAAWRSGRRVPPILTIVKIARHLTT